ncbi:MAG: 4-(cytidine 5'-diphospho)-2-C-methyl-D-erythritol kinase [Deltaproteobacteria bacterium]|nr:4-(cytidine 5'-diphospho)-2-C-methyl-D-erythritol kinase [Deltaproteobacteria bacterium]
MASAVSFLAPAKLNLSLQVFGKRPDGYHHIRSVMVPVSLYDEVTVEEAPAGISVECDAAGIPTDAANSCHKAAALFLAWAGTPAGVRIRIRKTIPAESGLGGGSSDAAAALKGLIALTGKHPPAETLLAMAVRVGADVPFFLPGGAALVEGFGERLTPLPWNVPFHAVIVRPAFGLSTREGYARLGRQPGAPPPCGHVPTFRTFSEVAAVVRNDFEAAWEPSHPEIPAIRRELVSAGAAAAGLSGSGSAVFGLFTSEGAAREARGKLAADGDGAKGMRIFVARSV